MGSRVELERVEAAWRGLGGVGLGLVLGLGSGLGSRVELERVEVAW